MLCYVDDLLHIGFQLKAVGDPITELIVMRRDEAKFLASQSVADIEGCTTAVTMGRRVSWIDAVSQEEGIPPLLLP